MTELIIFTILLILLAISVSFNYILLCQRNEEHGGQTNQEEDIKSKDNERTH